MAQHESSVAAVARTLGWQAKAPARIEPLEQRRLMYAGNLLVGSSPDGLSSIIQEYTRDGDLLGSANVPGGDGRDFHVNPGGDVVVWSGTFDPVLRSRSQPIGSSGTWTGRASSEDVTGWSTINRTFYGGVAILGRYVFVTDQSTGSGGDAKGLIRFDADDDYAYERFATDHDFSDCAIGMDGKLYAMNGGQTAFPRVKVYDPLTLELLDDITVPGFDNMSVTADSKGNIYLGGFHDGKLWKLSPDGQIITSVDLAPKDMDMSADDVLLTSDGATVRLLDTDDLSVIESFPVGSYTGATFAAFAQYQSPVTEAGSIAGTLFDDADADGVRDDGEGALAGWRVFLDFDRDGQRDAGEVAATTDAAGNYRFDRVAPGNHRVTVVAKSAWRRTMPAARDYHDVSVEVLENATTPAFGFTQSVQLSGRVWDDRDADGRRDPGEPGLGGWRVFIDADKDGAWDDGVELGVVTRASGKYTFDAVNPGAVRLTVVGAEGRRFTSPASGRLRLTLAGGAVVNGHTFGITRQARISGQLFSDRDGDGQRDFGDHWLKKVRLFIDADRDGKRDKDERSTRSGKRGRWSFDNLDAGTYVIRVVKQSTAGPTKPARLRLTVAEGEVSTDHLFARKREK